jgi:EAL domain-containing protein (putative c-di-GMP-specific phosphodiesterase class I)
MIGRIRMVIADDDPEVRQALADLIASDESLELVGIAGNAGQAIEMARTHLPDVALLDVKMPGTGAKAARAIHECSPRTAILALSAHEDEKSLKEMLTGGATSYLVKGTPSRDILAAVRKSVTGGSVMSDSVAPKIVSALASRLEREQADERLRGEWKKRVHRVLQRKDPLDIVFQPIVDLVTSRPAGVEALSRFTSEPVRSPDVWFAKAAQVGLGLELEMAAVEAAVNSLERVTPGIFMAVNVSPEGVASRRLDDLLGRVSPDRVVLEITEHERIESYPPLLAAIKRHREQGVRLAIDDAGAGYASLRHILQLTPDFIKLDIALTKDIEFHQSQRALASALVAFAREIGATITAEGIERFDELTVLRDLGVKLGQGYYLGRPGQLAQHGLADH